MEDKKKKVHTRTFGFNYIRWKIHQFCFEAIQNNKVISSPEFIVEGLYATKWKLSMQLKQKDNINGHLSVCLERLNYDNSPDDISVSFKIWFTDKKDKDYSIVRFGGKLKNNHSHVVTLASVNFIREKLKLLPYKTQTFVICCYLFVNFENSYVEDNRPNDIGVKLLSDDLMNLYNSGCDYDIILRIQNKDIYGHKAVLCSRSSVLANLVQRESMVIDLSHLDFMDYETVINVVAYMYSGNIHYISRNASIPMYEITKYLKLLYMEMYFITHDVNINSKINIKRTIFYWIIQDFSDVVSDCISSPPFATDLFDGTFRLCIEKQGQSDIGNFLSVYADVVEGIKPESCFFKFVIKDSNGYLLAKKTQVLDKSTERFGFEHFISEEILKTKYNALAFNVLHVTFTLYTSKDIVLSSKKSTFKSVTYYVDDFYASLSYQLHLKLKEGEYSDVILKTEDAYFQAPKCILSARSSVLKSKLNSESRENIMVLNMKSRVLSSLLSYIYSGHCENLAEVTITDFYKSAMELSLLRSDIIGKTMQVENIFGILKLSCEQKNQELKNFALKFIYKNKETIFEDRTWEILTTEDPSLSSEVIEYVNNE